MKRGQVSIYILIGLILIIATSLFIVYLKPVQKDLENEQFIKDQVTTFFESCLRQHAENGVYLIGYRGGYITINNIPQLEVFFLNIPYWYEEGRTQIPTKEFVQEELNIYINDLVLDCGTEFSLPGFNITYGKPISRVTLFDESIALNVQLPIILKKDILELKINEFQLTLPVRLGKILKQATGITTMLKENPGALDLTYVNEQDIPTIIYNVDEQNRVFRIRDDLSFVRAEPYQFVFSGKLLLTGNTDPILEPIGNLSAVIGERIVLQLNATDLDGDALTYSFNAPFGEIDETTGVILIEAEEPLSFQVFVSVEDDKGGLDAQSFTVTIK